MRYLVFTNEHGTAEGSIFLADGKKEGETIQYYKLKYS
jgi:hypothetical protein